MHADTAGGVKLHNYRSRQSQICSFTPDDVIEGPAEPLDDCKKSSGLSRTSIKGAALHSGPAAAWRV